MKKQIRLGLFETNSSSVHAISVSGDTPEKRNYLWRQNFNFETADFPRNHRIYFDTFDKASYLWTAIVDSFTEYSSQGVQKISLNINNPSYIKIRETIREKISNFLKIDPNSVSFQEDESKTKFGCIDGAPELKFIEDLVFDDSDRLIRFLFNGDSRVSLWSNNEWNEPSDEILENLPPKRWPEADEWVLAHLTPGDIYEKAEYVYTQDN